ncbi:4-hydroxy-tetrahydrodipicolinate reductase [Candidatus Poriferisodalis sp.]|uniref:4-hydroxy-tetrahydrodipicolinate reductase n=1 Tax=Candidatus Poriferisodalis sp. TaxID=3101277 RepID=UPI003B01C22E
MRVLVFGAGGRMGATVCEAVAGDPDLELVAGIDPGAAGRRDATDSIVIEASTDTVDAAVVDVAIDFTVAAAARDNIAWCAANGVHAIVGTSGLDPDDFERCRAEFTASNCLIAPNFAIGAVLMMRFAEIAAPFFPTAEVIELHHDNKVDAPSGTAMATVRKMAEASDDWAPDPTRDEVLPGARGGKGTAQIPVHSVRLRGLVAHQEVLLGTAGETLTIRHDSLDRVSFMPGVLLAAKTIADHPGVTIGLDAYLHL